MSASLPLEFQNWLSEPALHQDACRATFDQLAVFTQQMNSVFAVVLVGIVTCLIILLVSIVLVLKSKGISVFETKEKEEVVALDVTKGVVGGQEQTERK